MILSFNRDMWSREKSGYKAYLSFLIAFCAFTGVVYCAVAMKLAFLFFLALFALCVFKVEIKAKWVWLFEIVASVITGFFATYSVLLVNGIDYEGFASHLSLIVAHNTISDTWLVIVFEILIVMALYFLLRLFQIPIKVAMAVSPLPYLIFASLNYVVWQVRGGDIMFSDINSITTAMNVVGGYSIPFVAPMVCVLLPYILFLYFVCSFKYDKKGIKRKLQIPACVVLVLALVAICFGMYSHFSKTRSIEIYSHNGDFYHTIILNFMFSCEESFVRVPENYSTEQIDSFVEQNSICTEAVAQENEPTNIIVIMNESFMDPSIYSNYLPLSEDPIPFWHSLEENTIHGYASVATIGGGTSNSEFEFLTSISTAGFSTGVSPYTLYVDSSMYSLPYYLDTMGYRTIAMHPFEASGWNRTNVYPYIGFDEMYFEDSFVVNEGDKQREMITDMCAYNNVIDMLENNGDQPVFTFLVTIQNHAGYTHEDYVSTEYVTDYYTPLITQMTNEYLTLINQSDSALEAFLGYLSLQDERYCVLMFGDHQPELGWNSSSLNCRDLSSVIPYIIWTNYDMPEEVMERGYDSIGVSSLPYLSLDVLAAAGIELDPYYQFISTVRETIPCINQYSYFSPEQGAVLSLDEATGNEADVLAIYHYFQYDILFDDSNSSVIEQYAQSQISLVQSQEN